MYLHSPAFRQSFTGKLLRSRSVFCLQFDERKGTRHIAAAADAAPRSNFCPPESTSQLGRDRRRESGGRGNTIWLSIPPESERDGLLEKKTLGASRRVGDIHGRICGQSHHCRAEPGAAESPLIGPEFIPFEAPCADSPIGIVTSRDGLARAYSVITVRRL